MQQLELRAMLRREQRCALRRPVCVPGEIGGCHEALHSGLHAVSAFTFRFQFSAGIGMVAARVSMSRVVL
jgi:hypothetical protein